MPSAIFGGLGGPEQAFEENRMLALVARFDWAATEAGAIETWPEEIRGMCRTVLLSCTPMAVLLTPGGLFIFNDAACSILGAGFARSLGKPIAIALPQAAGFCREILDGCFRGRSSSFHDVPLAVQRERTRGDGETNAWFDLDLTPIVDPCRQVLGVLVVGMETTRRVKALSDLRTSRERLELALESGGIVGAWDLDLETDIVRADERFARLHGVDPELARNGADDALFTAGIHPDDAETVKKAFHDAMIGGTYRCQHRVVGPDGVRWIVCSGRFRYGAGERPVSFLGTAVDVTEQIETAAALAESEKRFRAYAETLPHVIFSCDRDGRVTYLNQVWYELTGLAEDDSEALVWDERIHPNDRSLVLADWRQAVQDQARFDAEFRIGIRSGDYRWMRAVALPLHDLDGALAGWIGTLTDVHQAKLLEAERELVSKELDHRIKNLFALTQGLIGLTAREADTVQAFSESLRGRLSALNESHGLIRATERKDKASAKPSLQAMLRKLTAPYQAAANLDRIAIDGDDIALDPDKVTPFALMFHELVTNAAKYGALRDSDGVLKVSFRRSEGALHIGWKEILGRKVSAAPGQGPGSFTARDDGGFGSRLLELVAETQLQGSFSRRMEADGLRIEMNFPVR